MDSLAARVWYSDSTIGWGVFRREEDGSYRADALIEFREGAAWPAAVIEPEAVGFYLAGLEAMERSRHREADSLLARAQAAHASDRGRPTAP